ncbi:MAG TPA: PhoU domain-containing protein [Thermoplasmata archaeon]|jgi:hypothetical protein|nr:PhoU domain-containing protein [Thermoplasmata archaeon]
MATSRSQKPRAREGAPKPTAAATRSPSSAPPHEPPALVVASVVVGRGELPEHLFRRLLGAYLAGAREFVVRERPTIRPDTREVVRSFCRRTRQPEILSEEPSAIRVRDLAFENPVPLQQRIARMGRLVVEFHRDAIDSWSRLPFGEDDYWERRDDEIDREAWYIQRLAAIGPDGRGPALLGPFTVARSLERIADHAVVLGETGRRLVDLPQAAGPLTSLKQFHHQAMEHLEGVLRAPDGAVANDLLDMGEALLASGRALADRLLPAVEGGTMPPATAAAIARLLESIGRTIAYGQDIAQVVLDRSLPIGADEAGGSARRLAAAPAA